MRSVSALLCRSRAVQQRTGDNRVHKVQVRRYSEAVKVPFDLIKQLRLKTKAGLTDCKDALAASNLDMAKAEDWLKERAKVIAAKKADRTAAEGVIAAIADKKSKRAVLLELLCETDFASRSPSYMKAAVELATSAYQHPIANTHGLVGIEAYGTWLESAPVKEKMEGLAFTLREKVHIRRVASITADVVGFYAHNKAEMPVDVTVPADVAAAVCPKAGIITMSAKGNASDAAQAEIADFGSKLARQVVAMNPRFLNDAQKAAAGPKPENEEQWETLYEQEYMSGGGGKQTSSVIKAHQKQFKHAHQVEVDVTSFLRWEVGEGVERKAENYGEEVAKLVNGR